VQLLKGVKSNSRTISSAVGRIVASTITEKLARMAGSFRALVIKDSTPEILRLERGLERDGGVSHFEKAAE
jgi:hypothetical protein